jgi:hypothetical protein
MHFHAVARRLVLVVALAGIAGEGEGEPEAEAEGETGEGEAGEGEDENQVPTPGVDATGTAVCNGDDACDANQTCSDVKATTESGQLGIFCRRKPGNAELPINAECAAEESLQSETCASGICDATLNGRCTHACDDDADCSADGLICTDSAVSNIKQRICAQACTSQDECGTGRSCKRRKDLVENANEFACDGDLGTKGVGETVASPNECKTALAIVVETETYCTQRCVDATDCGGAATECGPVAFKRPRGDETQSFSLCKKPL